MKDKDFSKKIIVGLTAKKGRGWKAKLNEIRRYKVNRFALFIEEIKKEKREELFKELLKLDIEEVPLVHLRHDSDIEEIRFLKENFKTKYFTIHEEHFNSLGKWTGFYKDLYLELNYDNFIPKSVDVNRVGGFCVDLSHFKTAEEKWSKEFEYEIKRKKIKRYFKCNHLNGYSYSKNKDIHNVRSVKDFEYLKTLPSFVFGKVIAMEMYNSIREQLGYKKYLVNFLENCFK